MLTAMNLGDNADTVGAVAGQIAGAIWGYGSISKSWTQGLAWSDKMAQRARLLAA